MLLVAMYYCENSCFSVLIPAVDAFVLDRPLPSSHTSRDRMHHIHQRHDHAYRKTTARTTLLGKDGDSDNGGSQERDATKNLVDKLTLEQRQALLQREMNGEGDNDDATNGVQVGDADKVERRSRNDRRNLLINGAAVALSVVTAVTATNLYTQTVYTPPGFQRFSATKFIAATGDPTANYGVIGNAPEEQWGVWNQDPGPRGVFLRDYKASLLNNKQQRTSTIVSDSDGSIVAPAGWKFDKNDWWLEEHGA
jgi:hypothetical protein